MRLDPEFRHRVAATALRVGERSPRWRSAKVIASSATLRQRVSHGAVKFVGRTRTQWKTKHRASGVWFDLSALSAGRQPGPG